MPEQHLLRVAQTVKRRLPQCLRHLLLSLCFLNLPTEVVLPALMNILGLSHFIFAHSCMGRSVINSSSSIVRRRFMVGCVTTQVTVVGSIHRLRVTKGCSFRW